MLDFGHVDLGRVRLALTCSAPTEVLFAAGEALGADGHVLIPGDVPGIASPLVHRLRFPAGEHELEQFEACGLRFLELHLRCVRPVLLRSVALGACGYPEGRAARFTCSDAALTRIREAGALTARVCRQDAFIDCPGREQRQWVGDGYVQALAAFASLADARLARRSLLLAAETQRPDGMIEMAATCDLRADSRVFVPDFCLLWVIAVERYLLYTGDRETAAALHPAMVRALEWFRPFASPGGLLRDVPGWTFIDWAAALERRGAVTAVNALFAAAVEAAAAVARACGIRVPDSGRSALAERIRGELNARLWLEGRGAYSDALLDGGPSPVVSQHANSLLIAFAIAPRGRWDRMLRGITDEGTLRLTRSWEWDTERPFDSGRHVVLAQPFFTHFLHAALRRAGRTAMIVENIRQRWAGMAETDGTFWESWQMTEHTSRCHGFSATPVHDIAASVLGVVPLRPGFERFRAAPWVSGLETAKGDVPTPAGPISVAWKRDGEAVKVRLRVPRGLSGTLELNGYEPARTALEGGSLAVSARRREGGRGRRA